MLPLEFEPILKRLRWGGTRLGSLLGKEIGIATNVAESWEISDQPNARSRVMYGPFAGHSLDRLIREFSDELLGPGQVGASFPLLIKFLDANDRLSVQVHPDDATAQRMQQGLCGKTESWYILHAEPTSHVYVGLKDGVTRNDLETSLHTGGISELLHSFKVRAGDVVHVPAGTVHAIGEGLLIAEIQQQSNVTFRLHDWNRLDQDGQARPLHITEALASIHFPNLPGHVRAPEEKSPDGTQFGLIECPYFSVDLIRLQEPAAFFPEMSFRILMVTKGEGELICQDRKVTLLPGKTVLLPASCPEASLIPRGSCQLLHITTNSPIA